MSAEDLIRGLASLRQDRILCDITLQTEGKGIVAHRVLLAAGSPYFRAMFGGNFKEAKEDVINLDALGVSHIGLSAIVDCLYSLQLNITQQNFVAITEAANLLQFVSIVPLCEKFLESHLDVHNCIQIMQLCDTYCMKSTKHAVDIFLLENFITVSEKNPDFTEIGKECLSRFVADTKLFTNDETEVFRAIIKWIKSRPCRTEYAAELIHHVRMHHIPLDVLTNDLANEPLLNCNEKCTKQLKEAIDYHNFPHKQPLFKTLPPRGEFAVMMLESPNTWPNLGQSKWALRKFPSFGKNAATVSQAPLPDAVSIFCGVSLGNFSYFICHGKTEHRHIRYDPISDKWLTLAPVPFESNVVPYGFMFESLQSFILLGGGVIHAHRYHDLHDEFSTCYMYSIECNAWTRTKDLPETMFDPLTCLHNNCLYVTSYHKAIYDELQNPECVKKMWMFDSGNNIWFEKAVALHKHPHGIFVSTDDKLFLAGGLLDNTYGNLYQENAEVYDIKSDQWSNILNLYPDFDIPVLCRLICMSAPIHDRSGNIYIFAGTEGTEGIDDDDDGLVALVFDPVSGSVSRDFNWECRSTVHEKTLVTVPRGRLKC